MMDFSTSYAIITTGDPCEKAKAAAEKIRNDLAGKSPALVIYFASVHYDLPTLAREMKDAFPDAITLGCTSAGEAVGTDILKYSVSAMAYAENVFEHCRFSLVTNGEQPTRNDAYRMVDEALERMARETGCLPIELDYHRYVGLVMSDQYNVFSERLIERLGEMTDVLFVGGIASDDYTFDDTAAILYDGEVFRNVALIGLLLPRNGFSIIKTQSEKLLDKTFTITRADEKTLTIWELDDQPATRLFADAVGVDEKDFKSIKVNEWALALRVNDEPFIRALFHSEDDKQGGFRVRPVPKEFTHVTVCQTGNIVSQTRKAIKAATDAEGPFRALLHFNCVYRYSYLEEHGQLEEFGNIFANIPHLGFASYGEIDIAPISLTSTILAFK